MRRPTAAPAIAVAIAATFVLAGCDWLGIESASSVAAKREAEGRAVGAGCRHSARSVEQCYGQNRRADKAAIFAGWKEMNEYMAANKIDAVPPEVAADVGSEAATEVAAAEAAGDDKKAAARKP